MPYALGPVKPWVQSAAEDIGKRFDVKDILGVGLRPNESDHPRGLALDFMVGKDKAKGDAIAAYLRSNASAYGVKYIIWYEQIWSVERASEGLRKYVPPTGLSTDTAMHRDHVHVSFNATPGTGIPTQNSTAGGSGISCIVLLFAAIPSVSAIAYAIHHVIGG